MEITILQQIQKEVENLTPSQQKVARYILKNPTEVPFLTMEQFALKAEVSVATIMRLAYYFGYTGYSELQKKLQENIREQLEPPRRLSQDLDNLTAGDFLEQYTETQKKNLDKAAALVNEKDLYDAANLIFNAKQVYLVAFRSSAAVAHYLEDRLVRMGIRCEMIQGDTCRNQAIISQIDEETVVVGVSFPRYAAPTILMSQLAKGQGAKIVALTDSPMSPLGQISDISLTCIFDSTIFHNSLLSVFLVADLLLLEIARNHTQEVKENLNKIEKVIKEMKANIY